MPIYQCSLPIRSLDCVSSGPESGRYSKQTSTSTSALSSYENDDYKEINHGSLIKLARFYDVSVDYLLCLSENRNHPDAELSSLHLSDEMVARY